MENEGYIFNIDDFYNKYIDTLKTFRFHISVRYEYTPQLGYTVHVYDTNIEKVSDGWQYSNQDVDIILKLYNENFLDEKDLVNLSEDDCSKIIEKIKTDLTYEFIKVSKFSIGYDIGIGIHLNLKRKENFSKFPNLQINSLRYFDVEKFILDNFDSDYKSNINITCNVSKITLVNYQNYSLDYEYDTDCPCIDISLCPLDENDPDNIIQRGKYLTYFRKLKDNLNELNLSLVNYIEIPNADLEKDLAFISIDVL
jgi:hypothetical protein